jgi:hypothetical protein
MDDQKQELEKLNKELLQLEQHMNEELKQLLQGLKGSFAERVRLNKNINMELEKRKLNELEQPKNAKKSELETLVEKLIDKIEKEEPPQKSEQETKEELKQQLKESIRLKIRNQELKELIANNIKEELEKMNRRKKELDELKDEERTSDQKTELEKLNTDLDDQNTKLARLRELKEQTKALEGELLRTKQTQWDKLAADWDEQLRRIAELEECMTGLKNNLRKELQALKTEVDTGTRIKDFRVLEKLRKELKRLEELEKRQKSELEKLRKELKLRKALEAQQEVHQEELKRQQEGAEGEKPSEHAAAGAATKEKVGEAWGTLLSVTKARAKFMEKLQGTKVMKTIKVTAASEASEQVALQKLAEQMASKPMSEQIALILRVEMPDKLLTIEEGAAPPQLIKMELEKLLALEELEKKKSSRESRLITKRKQIEGVLRVRYRLKAKAEPTDAESKELEDLEEKLADLKNELEKLELPRLDNSEKNELDQALGNLNEEVRKLKMLDPPQLLLRHHRAIVLILRIEMPDKPELIIEEELEKLLFLEELERKKSSREGRLRTKRKQIEALKKQIEPLKAKVEPKVEPEVEPEPEPEPEVEPEVEVEAEPELELDVALLALESEELQDLEEELQEMETELAKLALPRLENLEKKELDQVS